MPLFDFQCNACGKISEILMMSSDNTPTCTFCGSDRLTQKISAPSSLSGSNKQQMPGKGDTRCCGSAPGETSGCAGPGSCCGQLH